MIKEAYKPLSKQRKQTPPKLVVTRLAGTSRTRRVYQLAAIGSRITFGVHNPSLQNLCRGVFERVFFAKGVNGLGPPLYPVAGAVRRLNEFRRRVLVCLPP